MRATARWLVCCTFKAMEVLSTMLSEDAQNRIISEGQDMLSYSQEVDMQLTEYLKDVKSVIEENHMYIRIDREL